jgi:hypothetical protein
LDLPCVRGVDVVGVLVLVLLVMLLLELMLVLLGAGGDVGVLFGKNGYDAGDDFVVDRRCRFRIPVFGIGVSDEVGANWGNLQRCRPT